MRMATKAIVNAPNLPLVVKATAEVSRIVKASVNALMRRLKPAVFLLKMQRPGSLRSVEKKMTMPVMMPTKMPTTMPVMMPVTMPATRSRRKRMSMVVLLA